MRSRFITTLAAISLAVSPVGSAAMAADASALSIAPAAPRAGAQGDDANELGGSGLIIAGVAVVAAIILIIVLTDDDEDDFPNSP